MPLPAPLQRAPRPLAALLALSLGGCLQPDQKLPFALDDEATAARSIGPAGGVVSLPSGVAVHIPAGALAAPTQITLTPRADATFPGDAGRVVPGTVYDLGPAGLVLRAPARVALRLPARDVPEEEAVRLGVARSEGGRSGLLEGGGFDATSGLLTAELPTLGTLAAVVADDAIPLSTGTPPTLGGGTFAQGGGGAGAGGPQGADGPQTFSATCNPQARRCFSTGMVEIWASPELLDRLGGTLVIVGPILESEITFDRLDANGLPTEAVGRVSFRGELRVKLGESVGRYPIDESFRTGTGGVPSRTTVRIEGSRMYLARTTDGADRLMEYEIRRIGTGRLLTFRVEQEVELENQDGTFTKGSVIIFSRLRG